MKKKINKELLKLHNFSKNAKRSVNVFTKFHKSPNKIEFHE